MGDPHSAVRRLEESFDGRLCLPGSPGYEDARTLFNAMIDRRPAMVARCRAPAEVAAVLRAAREEGVEVAVRAGGHSVAGMSVCDGGIVIDVRPMNGIEVDPSGRTARVGAGCTSAAFDRAAQEHGLASTAGRVSTTGMAGFTLGGGSGWLERKHGLACDNLLAVELVTAAGEQVRASASENADLFWALHGGGGNFGVATAFTFQLHPIGPEVLAGLLLYPGERGAEALAFLRDFMLEAPDEVGAAFVYLTVPAEDELPAELHGRLGAAIAVNYAGPVAEAEEVLAPLRRFGPPAADLIGPVAFADFQCSLDDPPGYRNYWTAEYLEQLSDDAIAVVHEWSLRMPPGPSQSFLVPWGGAVARVGEDDTPLTNREATWVVHPFALWEDPADDARLMDWGRAFRADIASHSTGGVYLNFIGDEGSDRVRAAFGERKYARLAEIKGRWDPDNLFRGNQNIKPRRPEAAVAG